MGPGAFGSRFCSRVRLVFTELMRVCRSGSLVVIGDHLLHTPKPAIGKAAQELGLGLGLRRAGGDAQHLSLAILVDHHGTADDLSALAHLHIGGVKPEIGPYALQRLG